MRTRIFIALVVLGAIWGGILSFRSSSTSVPLMPLPEEFTSLWWKEGFPGSIPSAPWHQCLETGLYGFVFDTEHLSFPHFGPLAKDACLKDLNPAELDLKIEVEGKTYHAKKGGDFSRFSGPRLIASGTFLQRFDVTDLIFEADDGSLLNLESRLEFLAWHDRISTNFFARPGMASIPKGQAAFGKRGGGYGFDGTNRFQLPAEAIENTGRFSISFEAFVPIDFKASDFKPWLLCKGTNEYDDGNLGIMIDRDGNPSVVINRGGGPSNAIRVVPENRRTLLLGQWNQILLTYDGTQLHFYVNESLLAKKAFENQAPLTPSPLTFAQRGDGSRNRYAFRGIVDEIQIHSKVVDPAMIRNRSFGAPFHEESFDSNGKSFGKRPREAWSSAKASLTLSQGERSLNHSLVFDSGDDWSQLNLLINPLDLSKPPTVSEISVSATEFATGEKREVVHDPSQGWHRIDLDGIQPIAPEQVEKPSHDALERVRITLSNQGEKEDRVRLKFEKTARGFRQQVGNPITGLSAILRDPDGYPTGIPVQLSKNWHNHPRGGAYSGQWFHGITQIRVPPGTSRELELTICYGHWGGLPAASHAQLSLIGWGTNQRWDQSALGSWGESICYEPDQAQGKCTITDVRPFLVRPMNGGEELNWTVNVGGGDFFRLFDPSGERQPHAAMKAHYRRYGPCLTEVEYSGQISEGIEHTKSVSIARTNDLLRATYRIRLDVDKPCAFSRFVIFQVGADTYNKTYETLFAVGNEEGLLSQWKTKRGGARYSSSPTHIPGEIPWISMHEGEPLSSAPIQGAWANRGIILRSWHARLGGKPAGPWVAEYGNNAGGASSATVDIVPPPSIRELRPGDFVEATIEHIILPQSREDYLGPDERLKTTLEKKANTWEMVEREANGNNRRLHIQKGELIHRYPDIRIKSDRGSVSFTLEGGLGYVPITITGLGSPNEGKLKIDDIILDQAIHGNDFWQTNYDSMSKTWSRTYNVKTPEKKTVRIGFD